MAPPMIAPAARPPITPAPTAQPRQPASAVTGTAIVARARAPAAARAVRVFCIEVPLVWSGDRPSTERGFAAPSILRATGIEALGTRAICRKFVTAVHLAFTGRVPPEMLPCTNAERRAVARPAP